MKAAKCLLAMAAEQDDIASAPPRAHSQNSLLPRLALRSDLFHLYNDLPLAPPRKRMAVRLLDNCLASAVAC